MKGFFEGLTPEQQKAALAYRGEENHGDERFRLSKREPGAIWGGWWFWEPPPGKTKEPGA